MSEKVFLNDKLINIDKACVSVSDTGLLYGAGLFETMRSYNGQVFALKDHLDRLFLSAEKLSINNSYDKKFITEAIYKLLEANNIKDARLRLTLTAGHAADEEEQPKSTLLITSTKTLNYPDEYYKNGVMAILSPYRQNPDEPMCGYKSLNYFSRILALDMARKKRATEAIWFTTDNRLAEGCITNVFLVKKSTIYTPKLSTPVLAGIMRKTVCQLAVKNNIELVEKDLYINDCLKADEIFITNVIMKILPINRLEQHIVGKEKAGAVTITLQNRLDEFIRKHYGAKK